MVSIIGALREDLAALRDAGAVGQEVSQEFETLMAPNEPTDSRIADTTITGQTDERPEQTRR